MTTVAAIETAYHQTRERIYRHILGSLGNRDTAQEFTQETFTRALAKADSFTPRCGQTQCRDCTETWLMTIATHLVLDHVKSHRYSRELLLDYRRWGATRLGEPLHPTAILDVLSQPASGADVAALDNVAAEAVHAGVAKLESGPRECVTLRFFHGLSTHETATAMDRRVAAVRQLQHRAVVSLRYHLHRLEDTAA